jgi:hypothetical protein
MDRLGPVLEWRAGAWSTEASPSAHECSPPLGRATTGSADHSPPTMALPLRAELAVDDDAIRQRVARKDPLAFRQVSLENCFENFAALAACSDASAL